MKLFIFLFFFINTLPYVQSEPLNENSRVSIIYRPIVFSEIKLIRVHPFKAIIKNNNLIVEFVDIENIKKGKNTIERKTYKLPDKILRKINNYPPDLFDGDRVLGKEANSINWYAHGFFFTKHSSNTLKEVKWEVLIDAERHFGREYKKIIFDQYGSTGYEEHMEYFEFLASLWGNFVLSGKEDTLLFKKLDIIEIKSTSKSIGR